MRRPSPPWPPSPILTPFPRERGEKAGETLRLEGVTAPLSRGAGSEDGRGAGGEGPLRLAILLVLFFLPAIVVAAEKEKPPPPPPAVGVTVTPVTGGRRVDAVLPGNLIAVALPKGADGRRRIVALTAPPSPQGPEDSDTPEGPRSLYLVDPAKSGPPWLLREGLPAAANALAAVDLDGDGSEEVLVGEPGKIHSVGIPDSPTAPLLLLAEPGLDLRWSTGTNAGTKASFEATVVGRFRAWTADGSGRLVAGPDLELPVKAGREATGLWLSTPAVTTIPRRDGPPVWAAGPDAQGNIRLRTLLLEPGPGGATQRTESWSRLPAPESVDSYRYVALDGRPALLVTTAEGGSLFEKGKLRVFLLGADRSRSGTGPVLAVQTVSHRWQPAQPVVLDLDRDGHDDLVLLQPEGMLGGDMVVEAWFGRGNGRFETSSRKTFLNELEAKAWSFGQDVTGDGLPDLVAAKGGQLVVFAGTPDPRKEILDRRPRQIVQIPGISEMAVEVSLGTGGVGTRVLGPGSQLAGPRTEDLDGDGRPEVLLFDPSDQGRGRVTVVALTP